MGGQGFPTLEVVCYFLASINFSDFTVSSCDTYQVLLEFSIVSCDDKPSQKADLQN